MEDTPIDDVAKSHDFDVQIRFDSKGDTSRRVVVVSIKPILPASLARLFHKEGLWCDQDVWAGPVEQFQAALLRFPKHWIGLRRQIQKLLSLPAHPHEGTSPERTLVMGVLNVTPDSFFDGGRYVRVEQALQRATAMVADGADIIDVGGESTRPNAEPVSAEEEMARILPVIRAITRELGVTVSVDTYKADVAQAALKAGARIVNDISGLQFDPRMATVVAEEGAGLVVMHIKGTPRTMQKNPVYDDVVNEVKSYLARSCEKALAAGVDETQLWIDPGIGFGKTAQHNLTLLNRLSVFRTLGFPILVGTSNKSVIGDVLNVGVKDRLEGTAATVAVAIANGADAVRVHDVKAMKRVVAMTDAIVREGTGE